MNIDKHKYIDKQLKEYIETILAKSDCDFDENKFNQWLIKNDVEHKTNPSAYIKACFKRELEQGTFKPIEVDDYNQTEILAKIMPHLYKHLPIFGVEQWQGFLDETFFIETTQLYIYEHQILTIEELIKLNDKVMGYIASLKAPKLTDYRKYIKKAQALKGVVDWEAVEKIEDKERQEFIELMAKISEREMKEDD